MTLKSTLGPERELAGLVPFFKLAFASSARLAAREAEARVDVAEREAEE